MIAVVRERKPSLQWGAPAPAAPPLTETEAALEIAELRLRILEKELPALRRLLQSHPEYKAITRL